MTRDQLCKDCHGAPPEEGRSRCGPCARARRESARLQREERRARGKCLTCGVPAKRIKGRVFRYCATHLEYYRARDEAARAAR